MSNSQTVRAGISAAKVELGAHGPQIRPHSRANSKCSRSPGEAGRGRLRPDLLWLADIIYIETWAGFLYIAVVLDVFSRRVVGWEMKNRLRTGVARVLMSEIIVRDRQ